MPRTTCALTASALLLVLSGAACTTAPDTPGGAGVEAAAAPTAADVGDIAPAAASPAEAPTTIVPAEQIAGRIVPSDTKGLRPSGGVATAEESAYRMDLPTITFEFDSATLTRQGREQLDELARALEFQGAAGQRFQLAGHTDTAGAADYNQDLSRRRAEAAREYLVREHGIAPERLEAAGHGEGQLVVPTPDEQAEWRNRRVEVVNLGGQAG